jgi:putative ABC transport system permease protein
VVALVGTALGVLGGVVPAWAALSAVTVLTDPDRCLWTPGEVGPWDGIDCPVPVSAPLAMPWAWLAALLVLVPAGAALVQFLLTPSRVAVPRR